MIIDFPRFIHFCNYRFRKLHLGTMGGGFREEFPHAPYDKQKIVWEEK